MKRKVTVIITVLVPGTLYACLIVHQGSNAPASPYQVRSMKGGAPLLFSGFLPVVCECI